MAPIALRRSATTIFFFVCALNQPSSPSVCHGFAPGPHCRRGRSAMFSKENYGDDVVNGNRVNGASQGNAVVNMPIDSLDSRDVVESVRDCVEETQPDAVLEESLDPNIKPTRGSKDDDGDDEEYSGQRLNPRTIIKNTLFPSFFSNQDMKSKILNNRSYARSSPFTREELETPPILDDVLPEPTKREDSFYLSPISISITFLVSVAVFPFITTFLDNFITMESTELDAITSKFVPGVSIIYGTYISLTLSICYNRQRFIQDSVSQETAHLAFLLQSFVNLFSNDRERMVNSSQCTADQLRILVKESRGVEYMGIAYADPYSRLLTIVQEEERRLTDELGDYGVMANTLGRISDTIRDARTARATRLSNEGLALPPTHFLILKALTGLLLLGYAASALPTVNSIGYATPESSFLFGVLTSIYLFIYSVADDLNDPYNGVFQIRRGSSAAHLLQMKSIIASHHWLKESIKFEGKSDMVKCKQPGLADHYFESEQGYNYDGK